MDSFPADGGGNGTRQQRRVLRDDDDDETAATYLVCTHGDADDEDWRVVTHHNCSAAYGQYADEDRRMLNRDGNGVTTHVLLHSSAVYDQYYLASSEGDHINDRRKRRRANMDVPVVRCHPRASTEGPNANAINTVLSRCDFSQLGKPIRQVVREKSWKHYMGFPMCQTVPGTCALVACCVCVEALHRLQYEKFHGAGTFPCRAAAPRKLRRACRSDDLTHKPDKQDGHEAYIGRVLAKIHELGGVKTTNAAPPAPWFLPVRSWQLHSRRRLTLDLERVSSLLDRGPCVGVIWLCPWWPLFDASIDDSLVYRGCGSSIADVLASVGCEAVGMHAVVCCAYRICCATAEEEEDTAHQVMHVLVMDNHELTGPMRWIDYEELLYLYTIDVDRMEPPLHLGGRLITYPRSGCYS